MGQKAAQTVREIEEVRGRLTSDIEELQRRLPRPVVWAKRGVGVVVGGGVAGGLFWLVVRRARRKRSRAPESVQAVVKLVPDDVVKAVRDRFEDERLRQMALGVGAAWLLFRLAELRQLRRMQRVLIQGQGR